nr:DNA-directed DNA polymerase II small subunit [Candidatus Njordarchaeum guaymaensis]
MSKNLRDALQSIILAGYQLEAEAFELLKILQNEEHFTLLVAESLSEAERQDPKPVVITRKLIEDVLARVASKKEIPVVKGQLRSPTPLAKEVSSDLKILHDGTEKVESSGTINDFNKYFIDRFERLSKVIRERLDFRNSKDINSALQAKYGEKVKTIAIVMNKRERTNQIFLEIEDVENSATLLVVPQKSRELFETARSVLMDQVIGVEAVRGKSDLLIAEQIVLPDVPERKPARADHPLNVVLLSDIHVGSKTFRTEPFERLIMWLNGKVGSQKQTDTALSTKYVLIAGDLVDGIGVYPRQQEDLAIADIYQQYRLVAQYIEQIPDYIEVVIIPGNHDAVRQALPQPAIPKEFAEPVYEARNVRSLGNPSEIKLHGIHFLMYHGRSLDDVIARVPNLSMRTPEKAMEYLLKCRHLAPEYGARTSLAPENRDRLVIDQVPDVFQAGHIHVARNSTYKGTIVVNCGAWQDQTEYQRRMGVEPTPGIMPILNLQTMNMNLIDFAGGEATISMSQ